MDFWAALVLGTGGGRGPDGEEADSHVWRNKAAPKSMCGWPQGVLFPLGRADVRPTWHGALNGSLFVLLLG